MIEPEYFWTHTNTLLQTLLNVRGNVLELGCGHYSTAITAAFSKSREIICVDTNQEWVDNLSETYKETNLKFKVFSPYKTEYLEQVKFYTDRQWGVVFIDHGIVEQRGLDLLLFKNCAEVILMHDSHLDNPDDAYNSFDAIRSFKYFKEHSLYWPQTAVMSETNNLEWLQ